MSWEAVIVWTAAAHRVTQLERVQPSLSGVSSSTASTPLSLPRELVDGDVTFLNTLNITT